MCYNNIGLVYEEIRKYFEALAYYREVYQIILKHS
jgi:hypothetical protein